MSIITTGINIVANAQGAIATVRQFGRELQNTQRQAQTWANGYSQSTRQVEKSTRALKTALNADWSRLYSNAINGPTRDLEANLRRVQGMYDRTFRELGNKYQSMVMGSVALSMSGIGLQNVGTSILGGAKASLDVARDFETVMTQIQFYGQKTADEMDRIQKDIFDIAYRMPQTASEIGKAFLQAQKTGYSYDASTVMAEEASKISFMSMGKLDGEEALKYISQMKKLTNAYATEGERLALVQKGITDSLSVNQLTDKLTMTADVSAASIDSLWKTMQSSRSAFDNMDTDMDSMLTLSAVMSDRLQPRAAGQAVSSFGRGMNMAEKAKAEGRGTRGEYYSQLTSAMGGGVESFKGANGSVDILKYIEAVATKSKEIWGDGVDRTSKLISIFGGSAIDLFHAYDNYAMSGNMNMEEMRDKIRDAEGHSTKFMEAIMNTSYGTEMKLKAVAEQFQILFGTAIRPLFNDILDGLTFVIGKINEFVQEHPKLTKALGYGAGIAGALLVATGATMLLVGGILALYASFGNIIVQLARNVRVLDHLARGYGSAGAIIKSQFMAPLVMLRKNLFKLTAITFFVWMAWKNDFLRMRTTFTEWKDYITTGLADSSALFKLYGQTSASEWDKVWKDARNKGTLDNWIARNLTKARVLWQGLKEIFTKQEVYSPLDTGMLHPKVTDGVLSDDTKAKLEAMGLLGIVEGIYEAKVALADFWKGFQSGMKDGIELVKTLLQPLITLWEYLSEKILGLFQHFGYFENVNKGIGTHWEQWGQKIGYIVASVIAIRVAIWGWLKAFKMILTPFKIMQKLAKGIWSIFSKLGSMLKGSGSLLGRMLLVPQARQLLNTGRYAMQRRFSGNARQGAQSRLPYARQVINPTTGRPTGQVTYQRGGSRRGPTVIPSRNGQTSATLRSRGIVGRMRDMWLGQRYDPTTLTDRRGRTYRQIRTADGRVINDYSRDGRNTRNVRTGGLRGRLGRIGNLFGNTRGGGAVRGLATTARGLGKGLLKGLGSVITKGIPMLFKGALRLIPFVGWAFMVWEAISLIWGNWDFLKTAGGKAWDWIKSKAGLAWDWVKTKASGIWDSITTYASTTWTNIKTAASEKIASMKEAINDMFSGLLGKAKEAWNNVKNYVTNNPVVNGAKTVGNAVKSGANKVLNFFGFGKSSRTGEWYVPKDNMPYNLHQGEMVLTRKEAQIMRSMVGSDNNSIAQTLLGRNDISASAKMMTQKKIMRPQGSAVSGQGASQGSNATTIQVSFEQGAIQVANASGSEMKKAAKQMFDEFKRMVELDNMKHYKSARPRTS